MGMPPKQPQNLKEKHYNQPLAKFSSKDGKVLRLFKIHPLIFSVGILSSESAIEASPPRSPSPKVIKNPKQTPAPLLP
jgi:hypothetical protein